VKKFFWIVAKDLLLEYRSRRSWLAMLLLGTVAAAVFLYQIDVPRDMRLGVASGLVWLAVVFAGVVALDRGFALELEENCREALVAYPVAGATIYLAKTTVNAIALAALQAVLFPLFIALGDLPLTGHLMALAAVAAAGNVGIVAVGTLAGALAAGLRQNSGMLTLLLTPLAMPIVVAAAEATRLCGADALDAAWWRWMGLLGFAAFSLLTGGVLLADSVLKE
jgi:heme exporter protein B